MRLDGCIARMEFDNDAAGLAEYILIEIFGDR
jgi:hypothetical protein